MGEGEKEPAIVMREVEFEPVKECWNTYVLADMTKVKGRAILVKLLRMHSLHPSSTMYSPYRLR